jgi:uncharacterized protein YjbI with pentapeptide repeats
MAHPGDLNILERGVDYWNKWRVNCSHGGAPDFSNADFSERNLCRVHFNGANLSGANLSGANLEGAILIGANLQDANLRRAYLIVADFSHASLINADLSEATVGWTNFGNNDLRQPKGLESLVHAGPSTIGIWSVVRSKGEISEKFLRGVGLPNYFIDYFPSLGKIGKVIKFYSCFISYSSKDQEFVERLHADLQNKGVRCWFAPKDLKIGDVFRDKIDESIRLHDKLLLIISENSIASGWVRDEVEAALERERREKRTTLFPVQIDDAMTESEIGWASSIRRTRHVGDFSQWKNYDAYQKSFKRLLRDLKADESK